MKLTVPSYVLSLCQVLHQAGHDAYIVGGAIRDALLSKSVQEYDIATSATPENVQALFPHSVATGLAFGTVTVMIKGNGKTWHCEVTTFRKESDYSDHRRPDSVSYGASIEEDLSRRDFTINALAFNPITKRFVDSFGGLNDIKAKRIKAVRDPKERFQEDSLRLFRACRFAAQLNMGLEEITLAALLELGPVIPLPAVERIHTEWTKMLQADACDKGIALIIKAGLLQRVLPEIDCSKLLAINMSKLDTSIRWAKLIACGDDYKSSIKKLRFSKKEAQWIERLIERQFDPEKAGFEIHHLALSGQTLMEMGYKGKAIGNIQHLLQDAILTEKVPNEKQALWDYLRTKLF